MDPEREWWAALVRVLSHDAQTPLTTVVGFAQTLQRPGLAPDAQATAVSAIARNGLRLSLLLRNLVDASRLRTGELVVRPSPLSLADAADRARGRLADLAGSADAVEVTGEGATVLADRERLVSALVNVGQNALSFSPPGRPVTITVDGPAVVVEDEGPGFPPAALARATEAFWRDDDTPGAGAGLGLYVATRLVEAMGGRLELGNRPAGGASVRVTLPEA